jgi:hypothetical protein
MTTAPGLIVASPVGHGNLLHEIRPNDWDCQVAAEAELRHAVVDYLAGKSLSHKIS